MLTSLTGLASLETISGDLSIVGNEALLNLSGLFALERVQGNFQIDENAALSTLHGLQNLRTVTGMLSISKNDALTHLYGIDGVTSIGNLTITFNDTLSACSVESICNYLQDGGTATIGGNNIRCDSPAQVEEACTVATEDKVAGQLHVYPNPVTDALYVEHAGGSISSCTVFNAQGKLCPGVGIHDQFIDVLSLSSGIYYVRLQTGSVVTVSTFVKQ